jgi:hypothetical protein
LTQISLPFNEVLGGLEDISHVMADFSAILAVVNGDIRNDNANAAAAIAYSKLNLRSQSRTATSIRPLRPLSPSWRAARQGSC